MILAAGYLLYMYGRVVFGELSDFLAGLGDHLTDMTPVEILTLVPLGALVVVFGLQPGLLLEPVSGHGRRDARRGPAGGTASRSRPRSSLGLGRRWSSSGVAGPDRLGDACVERRRRRPALAAGRRGRALTWQDLVTISPLIAGDPDRGRDPGRRPHPARPQAARGRRRRCIGLALTGRRWPSARRRRPPADRVRRRLHGRRADDVPRHPVRRDHRADDRVRARTTSCRAACRSPSSRRSSCSR